jgi:hypothetical protein
MDKRGIWRWLLLSATLLLGLPSAAQAQYDDGRQGGYVQGGQRGDSADRPDRSSRNRDDSQARRSDRERGGSMTPDERRELNRDLQRANREIYRKGRDGR